MQLLITPILIKNLFFTFIVLIITSIISFVAKKVIDVIFVKMQERTASPKFAAKSRTLRSLIGNIIDTVLAVILILMILAQWGVNIMPILTGAGILGLAVSFGAQTLVKDIISGFFIIAENQFNIGDTIKIGDYEGEVIQITLRITVLKDKKGNKIYLPNSKIDAVVRYPVKQTKSSEKA